MSEGKPENRQKTGRRANRGSFPPGKTGNAGGRPKLPEDYKAALDTLGPKALAALDAILDNPKHPRHEQCAEYVMNRWKGTPTQRVEQSGPGGGPLRVADVLHMTREEMRREIEALEAEEAAEAGKTPGDEG